MTVRLEIKTVRLDQHKRGSDVLCCYIQNPFMWIIFPDQNIWRGIYLRCISTAEPFTSMVDYFPEHDVQELEVMQNILRDLHIIELNILGNFFLTLRVKIKGKFFSVLRIKVERGSFVTFRDENREDLRIKIWWNLFLWYNWSQSFSQIEKNTAMSTAR